MTSERIKINGTAMVGTKQMACALLADEQPIVRLGIMTLLRQLDPDFIFLEADSAKLAVELARSHSPSIALIDLSIIGTDSFEGIKKLRLAAPGMHILVISHQDEKLYAERAVRAGARGYVMKTITAKLISKAIEAVRDGRIWLSETLRDELVNRIANPVGAASAGNLQALSDREMSVFRLIGQGLKKGGIARELNLSPHTIESYRTNIKQKLGIASGAELYRIAFLHSEQRSSLKGPEL